MDALQACRRGDVLPQEIWSSGGVLRVYERVGGIEVWSSGALEVRCWRVDVEV